MKAHQPKTSGVVIEDVWGLMHQLKKEFHLGHVQLYLQCVHLSMLRFLAVICTSTSMSCMMMWDWHDGSPLHCRHATAALGSRCEASLGHVFKHHAGTLYFVAKPHGVAERQGGPVSLKYRQVLPHDAAENGCLLEDQLKGGDEGNLSESSRLLSAEPTQPLHDHLPQRGRSWAAIAGAERTGWGGGQGGAGRTYGPHPP